MFYKENRLDREIQWSGFGFQVWLQIMTHLLRAKSDSIIIIDEPDIYLHPDLQKKLMKTLRDRHKQYLVATHSVEIINDADGQEIVSINPDKNRGYRLRTTEDFDEIYGYIGAADNADYARIAKVKRVVFFEGNDKKTYLRFARRLNFNGLATGGIPFVKLGGFSQWTRAESAVWAFKEVMGIDITVFAVFDRDYRSDGEIEEFENSINSEAGTFRVLSVKEVENFLLNPDAICLAINKKEGATVSLEWVKDEIMKCTEELKHKVMSQRLACALEYHKGKNSGKSDATLLEEVSEDFESSWENFNKRMVILPGKISLNKFNAALAKHDIRGLTETQIVSEFRKGSIPDSLSQVLTELDDFCSTI